MECPICKRNFNNNFMSVQQHIVKSKDEKHIDFVNNQKNIVCRLNSLGYSTKEIVEHDLTLFKRKYVTNILLNNRELVDYYVELLKEELSEKFKNGLSANDLKSQYSFLSKKKILNYLHETIETEEFKSISYKIKNNKIKSTFDGKKKYNTIEILCNTCNTTFLGKENRKFCSRKCASITNVKAALKALKENPPNYSELTKKAYLEGRKTVSGGNTKWYNYKEIRVQGTYELRTCIILDEMKKLNIIKNWEYTNDKIPYIGIDEIEHLYFIDFKVFNNDDTFYYLEVKGYKKENDENKWKATRNLGYDLKVWFNEDINEKESILFKNMVNVAKW